MNVYAFSKEINTCSWNKWKLNCLIGLLELAERKLLFDKTYSSYENESSNIIITLLSKL